MTRHATRSQPMRSNTRRGAARPEANRRRPALECLEERTLLSGLQVNRFPLPTGLTIDSLTQGPDGNMWFTAHSPYVVLNTVNSVIGSITPTGTITTTPFPASSPSYLQGYSLSTGADGNLWFVASATGQSFTLTIESFNPTTKKFQTYDDPSGVTPFYGGKLISGPHGTLYFFGFNTDAVNNTKNYFLCSLGVDGTFGTDIPLDLGPSAPHIYGLSDMTIGPDGKVWFVASANISNPQVLIGSVPTRGGGSVSEYLVLRDANVFSTEPLNIVTGPDGNLWVTVADSPNTGAQVRELVTIDTSGTLVGALNARQFPFKYEAPGQTDGLAVGRDGAIWTTTGNYTTATGGQNTEPNFYRAIPGGAFTSVSVPESSLPDFRDYTNLTTGPGGTLWWSEFDTPGTTNPGGAITELVVPPLQYASYDPALGATPDAAPNTWTKVGVGVPDDALFAGNPPELVLESQKAPVYYTQAAPALDPTRDAVIQATFQVQKDASGKLVLGASGEPAAFGMDDGQHLITVGASLLTVGGAQTIEVSLTSAGQSLGGFSVLPNETSAPLTLRLVKHGATVELDRISAGVVTPEVTNISLASFTANPAHTGAEFFFGDVQADVGASGQPTVTAWGHVEYAIGAADPTPQPPVAKESWQGAISGAAAPAAARSVAAAASAGPVLVNVNGVLTVHVSVNGNVPAPPPTVKLVFNDGSVFTDANVGQPALATDFYYIFHPSINGWTGGTAGNPALVNVTVSGADASGAPLTQWSGQFGLVDSTGAAPSGVPSLFATILNKETSADANGVLRYVTVDPGTDFKFFLSSTSPTDNAFTRIFLAGARPSALTLTDQRGQASVQDVSDLAGGALLNGEFRPLAIDAGLDFNIQFGAQNDSTSDSTAGTLVIHVNGPTDQYRPSIDVTTSPVTFAVPSGNTGLVNVHIHSQDQLSLPQVYIYSLNSNDPPILFTGSVVAEVSSGNPDLTNYDAAVPFTSNIPNGIYRIRVAASSLDVPGGALGIGSASVYKGDAADLGAQASQIVSVPDAQAASLFNAGNALDGGPDVSHFIPGSEVVFGTPANPVVGQIIPIGGGNIVAVGAGGNIVGVGAGGNIVGVGAGGNIVGAGAGGNVTVLDIAGILAKGGSGILAKGGSGIVGDQAAGIIAAGAGNTLVYVGNNLTASGVSVNLLTGVTLVPGVDGTFSINNIPVPILAKGGSGILAKGGSGIVGDQPAGLIAAGIVNFGENTGRQAGGDIGRETANDFAQPGASLAGLPGVVTASSLALGAAGMSAAAAASPSVLAPTPQGAALDALIYADIMIRHEQELATAGLPAAQIKGRDDDAVSALAAANVALAQGFAALTPAQLAALQRAGSVISLKVSPAAADGVIAPGSDVILTPVNPSDSLATGTDSVAAGAPPAPFLAGTVVTIGGTLPASLQINSPLATVPLNGAPALVRSVAPGQVTLHLPDFTATDAPQLIILSTADGRIAIGAVQAKAATGSIQFSAPTYSWGKNGLSANVIVTRTGGADGTIGAMVSTADGTAKAGTDYTATSKMIFFADGDTHPRVVSVPLLAGNGSAGVKTINLALTNPLNVSGFGTQATAILTLKDGLGTLAGQVFDDHNGNGTKDALDEGLANALVYVDVNGDGVLNNPVSGNNVGDLNATEPLAVTDAQGNYTLGGLAPGTYTLRFVTQGQQTITTTRSLAVTVPAAGGTIANQNFGVTAPAILTLTNVPAGQTVESTSPAGAVVTFIAPTGSDSADPNFTVTCSPASGSTFPLGTTTVTCTLSDHFGNTKSATFAVTVEPGLSIIDTSPANGGFASALPGGQVTIHFNHPLAGLIDGGPGEPAGNPFAVFLLQRGPELAFGATTGTDSGTLPLHANTIYHLLPDGTSSITLTPLGPLSSDLYGISINLNAYQDLAGNHPTDPTGGPPGFHNFLLQHPPTTGGPLRITGVTSYNGFAAVNNNAVFPPDTLAIAFNKPLWQGAAGGNNVQLLAFNNGNYAVQPSVATYSPSTNTIYLTPTGLLFPGTIYIIRVDGSVSDDQGFSGPDTSPGGALGQTYYDSFSVYVGPATAQAPFQVPNDSHNNPETQPIGNLVWSNPLGYARVPFTEPLDMSPAHFGRFAVMVDARTAGSDNNQALTNIPLNAKLAFNPNTNQLIVVPTQLQANDVYVFILSGLQAQSGDVLSNAQGQPVPVYFTSYLLQAPVSASASSVIHATAVSEGLATVAPFTAAGAPAIPSGPAPSFRAARPRRRAPAAIPPRVTALFIPKGRHDAHPASRWPAGPLGSY